MPLQPTWSDMAIRLALTILAGMIIGFDRGARGHAAGLRTTILVGLAASLSMIQANLLLSVDGKGSTSFIQLDLMRLPLGILTGVGFIGGGTILKKGDLITGVTTAATLWLITVIGLCLGGGQLALGCVGTAIGVVTLSILKWVDVRIPRLHRAALTIGGADVSVIETLPKLIEPLHYHARFQERRRRGDSTNVDYAFEVFWRRPENSRPPVDLLRLLEQHYVIKSFDLTTQNGR
ncbi:MgtC/SapB family protein [Bradyrhizobium sp. ISRA443]|uniref:MgtC/SapB family protein n=1 Tax=unclassified Bradyrhizobium TaxID=2631580 RepID=UPI00247AA1C9|nr:MULTISPECIES: MgtC/SapB family protein [unclassified Bradyrhizobium]WGR98566.1 MgtC/SapB family protein [Bradyrhizobium sp. ISRA436]WGS05455.1 MgtC/SapB family protein [Bradyrhizobium sp. ISRA437]WGS12341.1 MgtC/SapB family protein [Bradyrhizobium sp. ISRA443]